MMNHLYAKPDETLVTHVDLVLAATLALRDRYEPTLKLGDEFWEDAIVTVLFHDFGKVTGNFQEMMELVRNNRKPDWNRHIRHEFISGMLLVFHTLFQNRPRPDLYPNPAQLLAIFSHHKSLNNALFSDHNALPLLFNINDAIAYIEYVRIRLAEYAPAKLSYTN